MQARTIRMETDFNGQVQLWSITSELVIDEPVLTAIIAVESDDGRQFDPALDDTPSSPIARIAFRGTSVL